MVQLKCLTWQILRFVILNELFFHLQWIARELNLYESVIISLVLKTIIEQLRFVFHLDTETPGNIYENSPLLTIEFETFTRAVHCSPLSLKHLREQSIAHHWVWNVYENSPLLTTEFETFTRTVHCSPLSLKRLREQSIAHHWVWNIYENSPLLTIEFEMFMRTVHCSPLSLKRLREVHCSPLSLKHLREQSIAHHWIWNVYENSPLLTIEFETIALEYTRPLGTIYLVQYYFERGTW